MAATGAQLIGSVNAPDAESVFRLVAGELGDHVRRIPDGETGDRLGWIGWQIPALLAAGLVPDGEASADGYTMPQFRVDGPVKFGNLGYADAAIASWAIFDRLQAEGVIPAHVRFQVSLPTPQATVSAWVREEDRATVFPAYRRALFAELDQILDGIPNERLALQWDVAVEIGILDGPFSDPADFETIIDRLADCGDRVPAGVELGYHFCYGDYGHEHFKQPESTALPVKIADRLTAELRRQINWITIPVPRHVDGPEYFAPLSGLRMRPGTEVYLGVVYDRADAAVSKRLIDLAAEAIRSSQPFGVCTECGMGRVPAEQVAETVRKHALVSAPVAFQPFPTVSTTTVAGGVSVAWLGGADG
jgi:hypothetical protein